MPFSNIIEYSQKHSWLNITIFHPNIGLLYRLLKPIAAFAIEKFEMKKAKKPDNCEEVISAQKLLKLTWTQKHLGNIWTH